MFSRNLLILQSTWEQDPSDWIAIQQRIEREAPDVEVRIANNGQRQLGDGALADTTPVVSLFAYPLN